MQFWNEILHSALLGSDKKPLDLAALPPDIGGLAEPLKTDNPDKEEYFLRLAATAFNYRQSGAEALPKEGLALSVAPPEEKPYCSATAISILEDLLAENSPSLIAFWLRRCREKGLLARPDILPALLRSGAADRSLRPDIAACAGKRGEWLGRLNTDWAFSIDSKDSEEETWQTGSPEQRRQVLQQMRRDDPAKARELLNQTWSKEDSATRLDLLSQLTIGLCPDDIPFLEGLSADKSKKIKEQALLLLKKIPGSAIVNLYWTTTLKALSIKKHKNLLGRVSGITLQLHPIGEAEKAVYDSGIEKLSNKKEFTDDEFLVYQLMQWTPLSLFETEWQLTTEELVNLFQEDPLGKKLFPALVLSIVNFSDSVRALEMMKHSTVFYLDLLPLLPVQQQEIYSIKFFDQSADSIIQYATQRQQEWDIQFTKLVLQQVLKSPYVYNRGFFSRVIHLLPVAAIETMGSEAAGGGVLESVGKLLNLKKQTINAFK